MKAELKRIHSPDILDFTKYWPEEVDDFSFLLQAMIGPVEEKSEESFDIEVCTPKWLLKNLKEGEILHGRHLLIIGEYDYDKIVNYIVQCVENCKGNNWHEIALKLSRLGRWEFEDYSEG